MTVDDQNEFAPVFNDDDGDGESSTATATPNEGQTAVGTYAASDADPTDTITYSKSGGADQALFSVANGGVLTFQNAPDYEAEICGGDNVCVVVLTASDGDAGTDDDTITITVNLQDVNEAAPVFGDADGDGESSTAAANVNEGQTAVGTYAATDADLSATITYSVTGGADQALFSVANGGVLSFQNAPDFEAGICGGDNECVVVLTASDGDGDSADDTITVTVTVVDLNDESPVFSSATSVTIAENTQNAMTLAASDADAADASVTFTVSGGADQALFEISGDTTLRFKTNSIPDYESSTAAGGGQDYVVIVTATDGATPANTATRTVTVTISDLNDESPVFSSATSVTIAENTQNAMTLAASDADAADASVTFTVSGGADQALFEISGDTTLRFKTNSIPNYESSTADGGGQDYVVIVTASDGATPANTATRTVTVTISDANEFAPVFGDGDGDGESSTAAASPNEGQTAVGTYAATDADGSATITYSVTGGADQGLFSVANGGVLTFQNAPDYEAEICGGDNVCVVVLTASDGLAGSDDDTITITVNLQDVNEAAPVFGDADGDGESSTAAANVNEGQTAVGTYAATDADLQPRSPTRSRAAPTRRSSASRTAACSASRTPPTSRPASAAATTSASSSSPPPTATATRPTTRSP